MYELLKKAQPRVLKLLENSIKNNRLSHAYLFAGPKGTFKKEMAYFLALKLYCKEDIPCYKCPTCKSILNNNHLNVTYIEPLGDTLKKEQIIALQQEYSKTSQIPGPRIYIINEADSMSASAANSLLKFIEEPTSEETYGILITENLDKMLPTILSRTILVKFQTLDKNILRDELLNNQGFDEKTSDVLSYLTNNQSDALKISEDLNFKGVNDSFNKFIELIKTNKPIGLFYRNNQEVLGIKNNLIMFLNLLEAFYRDTYEFLISGKVINFMAYLEEITAFSKLKKQEDLLTDLKHILELEKKLGYNVNISLLVNKLLIDLKGGVI